MWVWFVLFINTVFVFQIFCWKIFKILGKINRFTNEKKNKFREKQKIRNYFKMCFFCLDCLVRKILNEIFISVSLWCVCKIFIFRINDPSVADFCHYAKPENQLKMTTIMLFWHVFKHFHVVFFILFGKHTYETRLKNSLNGWRIT